MSKQYRGLTGAGLAQGKDVSVGAVPKLTGKLGLLKEGLESVEAISRLANLIRNENKTQSAGACYTKVHRALVWP